MNAKLVEVFLDTQERYSDDDSFCYAITGSPAELIEDFKVEFSKYLDYYKNLYGEFEINYGVVSYYN